MIAPVFVTSTFSLGTVNILVSLEPFLPLYFSCGSENSAQAETDVSQYCSIRSYLIVHMGYYIVASKFDQNKNLSYFCQAPHFVVSQ